MSKLVIEMININISSLTKLEAFISKFIIVNQFENVNVCIFVKGACYDSSRIWIFSQIVWVSHWFLASPSNVNLKFKFIFVLFWTMQNDAKFKINSRNHSSTIGCKTCNPKLKKLQPKVAISLCNFQLLL